MIQRLLIPFFLVASMVGSPAAWAASDVVRGLVTGGCALLGGYAGLSPGIGGGVAVYEFAHGMENAAAANDAAVTGAVVGALGGAIGVGIGGAALTDASKGRVAVAIAVPGAIAGSLVLVGYYTGSERLFERSAIAGAVLAPLAAGITAARYPDRDGRAQLRVAPLAGPAHGLALVGRF